MSSPDTDTPIGVMLSAATNYIPLQAEAAANASNWLSATMRSINEQAAKAGDPPLLKAVLEIGEEVYVQLRNTAISMDHAAQALAATAHDFVRTDDDARRDFGTLSSQLQHASVPTHGTGSAITPGDWTDDGGQALDPTTTPGNTGYVPSTPGPEDSATDKQERDEGAREDQADTPLPLQPAEED